MQEMSLAYWNSLANQMIVICSLLGGFSISVVINFLFKNTVTRLTRAMMRTAVVAASSFLTCLFTMTKILMMTTEGFPFEITKSEISNTSALGGMLLFSGIISLLTILALSGWTKSKSMGRFTTIISVLSFIIILYMMT